MIEFIRIQRFKSLHDASFPLSYLNIFSGLNGMGKSSLIQTLLLIRQSFEKNTLPSKGLLLKGEYVNLGAGQDILATNAEIEQIEFILNCGNDKPYNLTLDYSPKSDLQPINNDLSHFPHDVDLSLLNTNFQYLSADRVSPKSSYETSDYYIKDLNSIGNHGEYTAHYIAEYGLNSITIDKLKHPKANSNILLENIEKWMAEISPGIRIHTEMQTNTDAVSLNYAFEQKNGLTADFKPQNVGFGLTFALPVLAAILRAKKGDLLIIENPEAHLHPRAQAVFGKLCALAAENGIQLFIETHSDHFLNGVRVAVKEKTIECDKVKLYFLERNNSEMHASNIISPEIDENGRISQWPDGFFDETNKQLEKLL